MSFKEINIKQSYETHLDKPLTDFYIPVLENSIAYDRIAGYFSSTSLAVAARGIYGLINNNGKMRIIASPFLSEDDINFLKTQANTFDSLISDRFFVDMDNIVDEFQQNHLKALGWLLQEGKLEIKLAYISNKDDTSLFSGVFHQKIGIFYDRDDNVMTFSGSINETASGWLHNIEEFKVFKSWEPGQASYVMDDVGRFDDIWNGRRDNIELLDVPTAIKDKLISYSNEFDKDTLLLEQHNKKIYYAEIEKKLNLFDYQKEAVELWKDNNYHLLFEMATGTGKTRTAIGCFFDLLKNEENLVVIISCPQGTLSLQWKAEIESIGIKFENSIIADSTNNKNKEQIENALLQIKIGYCKNLVIYTTHSTGSSDEFVELIKKGTDEYKVLFIGDECHGLGSPKQRNALSDEYVYRIGLSATPNRWFDDVGSDIINSYFGDKSYVFTISQALTMSNPLTGKTFLNRYKYLPYFIELNEEELDEYQELTSKINKMAVINKDNKDHEKNYEYLLFHRANITKNAEAKYGVLESILRDHDIKDAIIFVSDKQIEKVLKFMIKYKLRAHQITQDVKVKDRDIIISNFKKGNYDALVAIKCLDEGIDIPSASTAIIMSSSTNPREYIQRIGRVIRQSATKDVAIIHDIIIKPSYSKINDENLKKIEKRIFEKELIRVEDMSSDAINNAEVLNDIYKIRRIEHGN